jgi:hypothetical protein
MDGPEYAPVERPDGFDAPDTPALSTAEPPPVIPPAPPQPPSYSLPQPLKPLAEILPPKEERRNAAEPFSVVQSSVSTSAWEAVGTSSTQTWEPKQPLGPTPEAILSPPAPIPTSVAQLPAPRVYSSQQVILPADSKYKTRQSVGTWNQPPAQPTPVPPSTGQWNAQMAPGGVPYSYYPYPGWAPPRGRVGAMRVFDAVTPGVLISLILGAAFNWFSGLLLILAFGLSFRIRYRRQAVLICFYVPFALAVLFALTLFSSSPYYFGLSMAWESVNGVSQIACCILPWTLWIIVWRALANHERPDITR